MIDYERIASNMGDLDEEATIMLVQQASSAEEANQAVAALERGMAIVNDRFDESEYFLGELIVAGGLMKRSLSILKPLLVEAAATSENGEGPDISAMPVILCTVEGDLHDIGKSMVKSALEANGLTVVDLGVNVPAQDIVEAVKENGAAIVALSGVMGFAIDSMRNVVEALKGSKLRSKVHVIVGGACVNDETFEQTGADTWRRSPTATAQVCLYWARQTCR